MARYMDWYGRCRFPLQVGFRVEVHDAEHQSENNTFRRGEGSMVARDPSRDLDDDAFRDHLTWGSRRAGPLISFTSNWNRAMERRKRFIEDKAQNIVVIAVWLEGLEVYDAYDVARHLPMKRPEQHLDEFLLYGNICADSYRILAMFHGVLEPENVTLSPQGWVFEASVPGGFAHPTRTGTLRNATEDFRDETYSLTGIKGGVKLDSLLRSIGWAEGVVFAVSTSTGCHPEVEVPAAPTILRVKIARWYRTVDALVGNVLGCVGRRFPEPSTLRHYKLT